MVQTLKEVLPFWPWDEELLKNALNRWSSIHMESSEFIITKFDWET